MLATRAKYCDDFTDRTGFASHCYKGNHTKCNAFSKKLNAPCTCKCHKTVQTEGSA